MPATCIPLHNYDLFEKAMACNGVLTKVPTPQIGSTPSPNFFLTLPLSPQTLYSPLRLEMPASAFFTHGYFQEAHVHISEATITD